MLVKHLIAMKKLIMLVLASLVVICIQCMYTLDHVAVYIVIVYADDNFVVRFS